MEESVLVGGESAEFIIRELFEVDLAAVDVLDGLVLGEHPHALVEELDGRDVPGHGPLVEGGIDQGGAVLKEEVDLAADPGHGDGVEEDQPYLLGRLSGQLGDVL